MYIQREREIWKLFVRRVRDDCRGGRAEVLASAPKEIYKKSE